MRLNTFTLFILLYIPVLTSYADVTEYDIEVVIFEDLSGKYIDSEQWPRLEHSELPEQEQIVVEDIEALETTYPEGNDVINISSNKLNVSTLDEHIKRLNASSRYHVLVHKSWKQTGLDAESAINIHVNSEDDAITNKKTPLKSFNSELGNANIENENKLTSSVSGDIKIILGRYLHIYTDLIYKRPDASNSPMAASLNNNQLKEFSIKTHRRMRSKELHYIDHPLVGILVMALPVEKTAEKQEEKKAENATQ